MNKKRNLSTKQKISTKPSTKKGTLLKQFSTACPCCSDQPLSSPEIVNEVSDFFETNNIKFSLTKDKLTNWRIKAKLAVRKYNRRLILGLFYKNSHKIASIKSCIAHHKLITQIADIIEKEAKNYSIIPYSDDLSTGDLRYVQIVVNDSKSKAQVSFVINNEKLSYNVKKFISSFKKYQFIESIWINYNVKECNVIFSNKWEHFFGKSYLWQDFLGNNFAFHPAAFMQAHKQIFEKILTYIKENISKDSSVLELFAGVGVIGLTLAPKCKNVTLVENNPFSKVSFDETLKKTFSGYIDKVSYISQDASLINNFENFDVIILDPPRKGLSKNLIEKLCKLQNKTIIYVSCNFLTFKKDVEELVKNKYRLTDAKSFLMFPGSNHLEIVAILKV